MYKEYFDSNNPGNIRLYGLHYQQSSISDYKIENELCEQASAIVPVKAVVSNREFNIQD